VSPTYEAVPLPVENLVNHDIRCNRVMEAGREAIWGGSPRLVPEINETLEEVAHPNGISDAKPDIWNLEWHSICE
jgi:hypothetical protein